MAKETCTMNPPSRSPWIGAAFRALMSRLRGLFETYRRNKERRDAFLTLLRLDDQILDDIGVIRAEVECAARLPLRSNASDALAAKADARRKGGIG
ncbi:DUF1127 domain-containing protein [Paracoccus denitrificans]|uniref:DUF1127 domain-containing protein n=1 Tax=Paracoccus denitrificans TaxID=266 RepID=UPI001319EBAE|nr:DUF1127 domain-containing protein [Paracoccus denitrificans]